MGKKKILFVCTANTHRSPTAEELLNKDERFEVRSCGIHPLSPTKISRELLVWADKVFVMEQSQRDYIEDNFSDLNKNIIVLNIADNYWRGDEELIKLLKEKLKKWLLDYRRN